MVVYLSSVHLLPIFVFLTMSNAKAIAAIQKDLFSENEAHVRRALEKCREIGNVSMINPLLTAYATSSNTEVRTEIGEMLSTLKISATEEFFIDFLRESKWQAFHADVVGFMWNSAIEPVDHLSFLTQLAIEGNDALALEIVTLIDSIESSFPEDEIAESIVLLKEYLSADKQTDSSKHKLLRELLSIVETLQESFF